MDIFQDVSVELQNFFSNLNWLFIFMFSFIIYGINSKPEFDWYNRLMSKNENLKSLKIWIAGLLLLVIQCLFCYLKEAKDFNSEYVSQLLRSWLIVIVFNSTITKKIEKIEKEEGEK